MTTDLHYLAYSVVLTWVMLMTASLLRARAWTPKGLWLAFGNRDDLAPATALDGRADRAARNMLENLVLFSVVVLIARLAGVSPDKVAPGAALFFWARLAYFPIYLAGIVVLRTVVWTVGIAGMVMIMLAAHG